MRKFALETGSADSKMCQLVKQVESQFKTKNIDLNCSVKHCPARSDACLYQFNKVKRKYL